MNHRILLFGAQGMLGTEFLYRAEDLFEIIPLSRFHLDLTDTHLIEPEIQKWNPDIVLNGAAWTAVDDAEQEKLQKKVFQINSDAPEAMARACKNLNIPFFHISTDYVFGGQNRQDSFSEQDTPCPQGIYATSKYEGEERALQNHKNTYILRTAWLYGEYGPNFVSKILHLLKTHPEITVVNDQFGCPTWTKYVATSLIPLLQEPEKFSPGIYHLCSEVENTRPSWHDFAQKIKEIKTVAATILPVSTQKFHSIAPRPVSSVLKNTKLPPLPSWEKILEEYLGNDTSQV